MFRTPFLALHAQWRALRAAFVFLTRIPVGGFPYQPAEFRQSTAYFPVVGLVLGLVLAALWSLLAPWSPPVRAGLILVAGMLLTGGFHEDGLADTADALGGSFDRSKLFVILKDSRLGTYGTAALCLSLLLRWQLLVQVPNPHAALVLSACLARCPPVWLMASMPYVSADGASKSKQVALGGFGQAWLSTALPLLLCALCVHLGVVTSMQLLSAGAWMLGLVAVAAYRFHKRAGGVTGDFLGASEQLCEVGVLLGLAHGVAS